MLVVGIIAGLLIFLLIWLLVAPLAIAYNSEKGEFFVDFSRIIRCSLYMDQDLPWFRIHVPFYTYRQPLTFQPGKKEPRKITSKKKKAEKRRKRKPLSLTKMKHLIKGVLSSFQLRRFYVNIDTDDYFINAQLVPVFTWINQRKNVHFSTNFQGIVYCDFLMTNRLYRMILPVIRYL